MRIVLFWVRDEREGPIAVKDRRLGTDRRRSRQRTVVVSDVSYATVYLVRHALAGIERATCSTDRLAVRTASCGSRRERFVARRVGEHVSFDVSLCTSVSLDNKYGRSVKAIYSSRSRWTACTELCAGTHQEDRRTARRARWGARTVRRGAHGGFERPP